MDFSLCGVGFRVGSDDPFRESALNQILKRLFSLTPPGLAVAGAPESARPAEIRVHDLPQPPVSGELVFDSPVLSAIRTEFGYHLRAGDSFLAIDLRVQRAEGSLSAGFLAQSLEDQRGIFLFAFVLLLAGRGLYGLHASCAAWGRDGLLMAGRSGSGKTTLTCSLARSGWEYLSDDSVLLRRGPNGVEALAFGRPFHCVADLFGHFPELSPAGGAPTEGKYLIDVTGLYPGQFRCAAYPRAIVFPRIVRESRSRLIPLTTTGTMVRLLRDGTGLLHGRDAMAAQLTVLTELAKAVRGFRLLSGEDVHRDPARVSALLQTTLHTLIEEGEDPHAIYCAA